MSNNRRAPIINCKCSCKGFNLDKFLQPNILVLLAHEKLHGYLIIQKLKAKDVGGREKIDNTGVYRALQTMEKKAMVASSWDVEGVGAAKKIYRITPVGQRCLLDWRNTLMEYRNSIGSLITDIEAVIGSEAGRDGF